MEQQKPTNDVWPDNGVRYLVIRVNGRQLVRTSQLAEAQWAARAAAQAGEGAEIVDGETGQVIERHPPQNTR
jgi:hypothetical protein